MNYMTNIPAQCYRILVIDDDKSLLIILSRYLEHNGMKVTPLSTLKEAKSLLNDEKGKLFDFDLVILDINLPDGSGYDFLHVLKAQKPQTSVLIISSNNSEKDKVKGLESGAEDYMCKPFELNEFYARVRLILRRNEKFKPDPAIFRFGQLEVNFNLREVTIDQKKIKLTITEFDILKYIIQNRNGVIKRADLINAIWGGGFIDNRIIDPKISILRKKLANYGHLIETVPRIGYKFVTN